MTSFPVFRALAVFAIMLSASIAQAQSTFDGNNQPIVELPGLLEFAPQALTSDNPITVTLEAVLLEEGEPIENGLVWRIFDPTRDEDGKLKLIGTHNGGSAQFDFDPGEYFVHVAFGRASVTKRLNIEVTQEIPAQRFVLDAGGVVLKAVAGGEQIQSDHLKFSIYSGEDTLADIERQLILEDINSDLIVRLNEGTYHIVSTYGDINAVTRADVRVEKGQLTELQMRHRAAEIALKLVSKPGGQPIVDTAWTIYSSTGDIIFETIDANPRLILSEGDYSAIAIHQGAEFPHDFHVAPGRNTIVEVPLPN